jgi:hypothetical protein
LGNTVAEAPRISIGAPEELEFPQGSKSKFDLSPIYPEDLRCEKREPDELWQRT